MVVEFEPEDVLGKTTLTASLYFLPAPICGLLMNIAIGAFLPHLRPSIAIPVAWLLSGIAPLLLATLCRLDGPDYWRGPFQTMALKRGPYVYDRHSGNDSCISIENTGPSGWSLQYVIADWQERGDRHVGVDRATDHLSGREIGRYGEPVARV
ncbi:MFS general substrate transporter [Penicillium angulare]|uniref:MFS general substrate transporter n=1 Tax=Penicillium angulare TaxID=116970 RepID=UPI00253F7D51|nr:MFS general substrate transporter [Penicillium angulare]KAJ5259473.1 MFS general substrate transporter [Penicillium angulare]